jgi:hypothetical protein
MAMLNGPEESIAPRSRQNGGGRAAQSAGSADGERRGTARLELRRGAADPPDY